MTKEITSTSLRRINIGAGVLHLVQMIAVLALASDFTLPVTARYMSGPPGSTYGDLFVLYNAPLAIGVAIFLGLSSLAHFIVVSPQFFPRYIAGLAAHRNFFRWVEYSISSSVMIVLIAQVTGISDITALISIFGVNASMILFGWLQEKYEEPGNGGWVPIYLWMYRWNRALDCSCILCICNRWSRRREGSDFCLLHRVDNLSLL
jgi:hypothetical protein